MINRLLYQLTARLPCRLIPRAENEPYLERYYVGQLLGVTFYLHRFVSSDEEPHLHNHPWNWGRALVLAGSYDEEYVTDLCPHATPSGGSGCLTETHRVRWWNKVNGNHFHRIANAQPGTWTLFFHGPRSQVRLGQCSKPKGWGFLENFYGVGIHNVTVFRPFPVTSGAWWLTAPKGREAGRETL